MNRVFTQNNNISFIDYNNYLKSNAMLNNSLTHGRNYKGNNLVIVNNEFINFLNYDTFFNISKGYFRRFVDSPECVPPITVNEGKKSSVFYETNDTTDYCLQNAQVLYPHGKYINKKESFSFLTKLIIPDNKCSNICNNNDYNNNYNKYINPNYYCKNTNTILKLNYI